MIRDSSAVELKKFEFERASGGDPLRICFWKALDVLVLSAQR
jgi:hypothetical protein